MITYRLQYLADGKWTHYDNVGTNFQRDHAIRTIISGVRINGRTRAARVVKIETIETKLALADVSHLDFS